VDSNTDWSNEFESLLSSPLGRELISQLTNLKQRIQDDAAIADTAEQAFGLLKESGGVIKAIEHLQFLSAVLPSDEGSKDN
jgi:hypothetical protein